MNDDTRRVLDLLAQGKITVDEADQLLRAMAAAAPGAAAAGPDEAARPALRWVRIAVHKQAKEGHKDKDVNIRDGDQDGHVACRVPAGDGELIEVPRVVVVDRAPDQVAKIASSVGSGGPGQGGDLRLRRA